MENSGNEMAYFIMFISFIALVVGFYIDKIDFTNHKKEHQN